MQSHSADANKLTLPAAGQRLANRIGHLTLLTVHTHIKSSQDLDTLQAAAEGCHSELKFSLSVERLALACLVLSIDTNAVHNVLTYAYTML